MVKSMTGYGRARETLHQRDITVEVRSVNNRFLDCTVKMPRAYVFAEDAVKAHVRAAVSRGKVDVFVTIDASAADVSVVTVNQPLARRYYETAVQMDPGNAEYQRALDMINGNGAAYRPNGYGHVSTGSCAGDNCTSLCAACACMNCLFGGGGYYFCC